MRNGFRLFLMGALGVAACALTARAGDGDRVTFDSLDGVTLEGTFYKATPVAPAKDKNATVLLLHNVGKGGGSSHQDKWDDLAKGLSDDGYSVLSFDFRGFGNSHKVSPDFWDPLKGRDNINCVKGANRKPPPDTIDHTDFDSHSSEYYPVLVNDVSAAKSFLDKHSASGQANSSNLILVGAGEGATIGAMWMYSQWHLQKVASRDPVTGKYTYDTPEGQDIAGAVWLDLSPKLGGSDPSALHKWLVDVSGANKVPMAFVYGKDNESAASLARTQLRGIEAKVRQDNPGWSEEKIKGRLQFTDTKAIDGTKLGGSQLLGVDDTQTFVKKYVDKVMDDRGPRDPRSHDVKMDLFLWTFPGGSPLEAKLPQEDSVHLVPIKAAMRSGG